MDKDNQILFTGVKDPRVQGRCKHLLYDILFIALCTLLSNGEDYEDMVEFGKQRIEWLGTILNLPNGIPSHDTFNRVLQIVDSESLSGCLKEDGEQFLDKIQGKLINFDGKKLRGANPRSRGNSGLYILSAWVSENRLCIGQKKVRDKSNEITAIPELLDSLDLESTTISIDAIGCQKEIAEKIIGEQANYLLAVKANQGNLSEEVTEVFEFSPIKETVETHEKGHGREEIRNCQILSASDTLSPNLLAEWVGIKTLVKIEETRIIKGVSQTESRYYISSEEENATYYNNLVRGHWGIENQLHWHLDVTFNEDACRARKGNAPQNLNILRKLALHRLTRMKDKLSLKKRRYRASLNNDYLQKVLLV